ncbi:phospholipase D-like domain-containing protein [Denitratisoma sp. agr-D3]
MKYLDTGSRLASNTLAYWLENALSEAISELRVQTGFFSLEGVGLLIPALAKGTELNLPTKILIGSNDGCTLRDDVTGLATLLGIPRSGAQLGVVSFNGGFFHPKTYHVRRHDGSEAAFVGSANLTTRGLSVHVEAGIALDTREGDDPQQLSQIAAAIDSWFSEARKGMTIVSSLQVLDDLVANGILALAPQPKVASTGKGDKAGKLAQHRLQPLCKLPSIPSSGTPLPIAASQAAAYPVVAVATVANQQSESKPGFPAYFLFDPTATAPTLGTNALSGTPLPEHAVGIIITLTKDSDRLFTGKIGTNNITLPIPTVPSLRFGVGGDWSRPWANFDIQARYVAANGGSVTAAPTATSVQAYGYIAGEKSSQNIRLVVVKSAVSDIALAIAKNKWIEPKAGDLAFLEWPTAAAPTFRLSFLERTSALYASADALFNGAKTAKQLVGKSACWLPSGFSPSW